MDGGVGGVDVRLSLCLVPRLSLFRARRPLPLPLPLPLPGPGPSAGGVMQVKKPRGLPSAVSSLRGGVLTRTASLRRL